MQFSNLLHKQLIWLYAEHLNVLSFIIDLWLSFESQSTVVIITKLQYIMSEVNIYHVMNLYFIPPHKLVGFALSHTLWLCIQFSIQ